jgi:hypothetical protein
MSLASLDPPCANSSGEFTLFFFPKPLVLSIEQRKFARAITGNPKRRQNYIDTMDRNTNGQRLDQHRADNLATAQADRFVF